MYWLDLIPKEFLHRQRMNTMAQQSQVTYEGQKTDVLALVTPALQDEVLLSWRTLQRLDVIPKEFPRRRRMNTVAQRSEVESRAVAHPKKSPREPK